MTVDLSTVSCCWARRVREKTAFQGPVAGVYSHKTGQEGQVMVFSERELHIIRIWGDNVIHGGHWGDGDVIFPDEDILMRVIARAVPGEDTALTPRNLEILAIWSDTSTDTPEEQQLRHRIREAVK